MYTYVLQYGQRTFLLEFQYKLFEYLFIRIQWVYIINPLISVGNGSHMYMMCILLSTYIGYTMFNYNQDSFT